MKFIVKIFILLYTVNCFAQEDPVAQQYIVNKFLLNPAIAGYSQCDELRITHRQQWVGMNKGPMTPVVSYHARVWQGLGIGGYVYSDRNGLSNKAGGNLSLAYHIKLNRGREVSHQLSFGLSFYGYSAGTNISEFTNFNVSPSGQTLTTDDPTAMSASRYLMIPGANTGVYYMFNKFFFGASVFNLVKNFVGLSDVKNADSQYEPYLPRTYYVTSGYFFSLSSMWGFEPSLVFKLDQNSRKQIDFNTRVFYQTKSDEYIWFGLSLRSNISTPSLQCMPMVGLRKGDLFGALTYDLGFNSIQRYNYGSVGVMVGWNLCRGKRIEKAPCPAFKDRLMYKK